MPADWLMARTEATPEALALMFAGRSWSFGQLDSWVTKLSLRLAAEGVLPSQHIGLLAPNTPTFACCVFALARLGAVVVPFNTRLTATEIAWQLRQSDCSRLLCTELTAESAGKAARDIPCLTIPGEADAFEKWLGDPGYSNLPGPPDEPEQAQGIVFTSGTTGYPKGAIITYANHFWSAVASAVRLGVHTDDRWLVCMPLYHIGGLAVLFRSCLYGTAVLLHDGFETDAVLASIASERATLLSLVPTMLERLLDAGLSDKATPALRLVLLGGASASSGLLTRAAERGLPVAVTYGATEAASQVATMMPERAKVKPGSVGRPLMFTSVEVVDGDGHALTDGEPGEIVVSGPTVMAGYYNQPAATAEIVSDGRLHTGDVGYFDVDGDLWILSRRTDLIISGGENIYPAEIERVLGEHPAVGQACVVGLPHPVWGQQVAALVTLKEGQSVPDSELLAFCRQRLAGYKQPRILLVGDEIPMTSSGKIRRRAVVEILAAEKELA